MRKRRSAALRATKSKNLNPLTRHLTFESLEERRLLDASGAFAQASWLSGDEVTVVTVDTSGAYQVYYSPNFDLGYLDPATGDLLICDYYPGTDTVFALTCNATGNVSNLDGLHYSNGQLIATDGGNTVYHKDGSLMRSGGSWYYDAGMDLKLGTDYTWENGTALKTGSTFYHPNGATLRDSANSIYYATANTFYDAATEVLSYPTAQPLRNAAADYFYETGAALEAANVNYYSGGGVMVDATGVPHNANGSVAILPFLRTTTLSTSEVHVNVTDEYSETTTSIAHDIGGAFGAYVAYQQIVYRVEPPQPTNLAVTTIDDHTLRFSWTSGRVDG